MQTVLLFSLNVQNCPLAQKTFKSTQEKRLKAQKTFKKHENV